MSGGKIKVAQAREADHEFKTRMAAEGRAIYIPGKTDDQIEAERAQRETPLPITLHLSEEQLSILDTALDDITEALDDMARVASFMGYGLVVSDFPREDAGCILRLCARAVRQGLEREIAAMADLDHRLRTARPKFKGGKS